MNLASSFLYGYVYQIAKTVCSQSRCEYAGTCRNVECPLVKLVGAGLEVECPLCVVASVVNRVMGKTCGDSVLEVVALMYSIVCVETIQR